MPLTGLPGAYGAADPLFLLLIALAIEAYIGDRRLLGRWSQLPRQAMARLSADLARRLDRPRRSPASRRLRGWLALAFLVLVAAAAGLLIELARRHYPFAWLIEVALLVGLVGQRGTWVRLAAVARALDGGSLAAARAALIYLAAGRLGPLEAESLGRRELALAALGSAATRFAGLLVAPCFWYVLLGLPGLLVQQILYVAAAAPKAVLDGDTDRPADQASYGAGALRCDYAVLYLPDRVAGLLLAAAALFVPDGRPVEGLRRLVGSRSWAHAALGGALSLAQDSNAAAPTLLRRALYLLAVAYLLNAGLLALVALGRLAV